MTFAIVLMFLGIIFDAFQFAAVNTYVVTLKDVGMAAFVLTVIKRIIWDGQPLSVPRSAPMFFLLAAPFFVLLSGIYPLMSHDWTMQTQFLKTTLHFIYVWVIASFSVMLCIPPSVWEKGLKSWLIASIPVNIFGAYQIVARAFDLPFAWLRIFSYAKDIRGYENTGDTTQLSLSFEGFYRATSVFSEPSALAAFNAIVLTAILIPYIRNTRPFIESVLLRRLVVLCSSVGLFLTFSLTGLSMIIATLALALLLDRSKQLLKMTRILGILFVLLLITDVAVEYYAGISVAGLFSQRLGGIISSFGIGSTESTIGESFFTRADSMAKAMEIWSNYPIFGHGIGCFYHYTRDADLAFTDSTLFQALADTGIGGFLTVVCLNILSVFKPIWLTHRNRRNQIPSNSLSLAEFAIYLGASLCSLMFSGNSYVGIFLWLFWGMIFSITEYYSNNTKFCIAVKHPLRNLVVFGRKPKPLPTHN
ncbi:hypothetical protein MASR2M18_14170 [Ignavibacteria bacterium]|nr:hypothetical protein [Bacteroidota bacterium]MCZ2132970.1 hypothetical protein [Bacteroidota bacterium]